MKVLMATNYLKMQLSYFGRGLEALRKISQYTLINGQVTLDMVSFIGRRQNKYNSTRGRF